MADVSQSEDVSITVTPISPTKTYTSLNDVGFREAAGLQRSGTSGRKSSVEKLLEQSLNTSEDNDHNTSVTSNASLTNGSINASLSDSDDEGRARSRGKPASSSERPQNLKSDEFIVDAGLSRTGTVPRKSSMEKLLEDQLLTEEPTSTTTQYKREDNGDKFIVRNTTSNVTRKTSSSFGDDDSGTKRTGRKGSVYEQKQIEAPVAMKGNRITARTENLFKQYEKDMSVHEPRPIDNVNESSAARKESYDESAENKRKVDLLREEKENELKQMRLQYQQRLAEEEREAEQERRKRRESAEVKYVRSIGDMKSRYLASTAGAKCVNSDDEKEEIVDKNGVKIERSGGKTEIVKSSDGVSSMRERFGSIGKNSWNTKKKGQDTDQVDSGKISAARSMFKSFESTDGSQKPSFNRPTSRKVRDPKELMEMRKKLTYGQDQDGIPQDGVVKKSVVLDDEELGRSPKTDALTVYKQLESSQQNNSPVNKPKTRLLSDGEARANMEIKKIDNMPDSYSGDASVDNASDYGSGTPCSPTLSDGYSSLSDTKEVASVDSLKETSIDDGIAEDSGDGLYEESSLLVNGEITDRPSEYV